MRKGYTLNLWLIIILIIFCLALIYFLALREKILSNVLDVVSWK